MLASFDRTGTRLHLTVTDFADRGSNRHTANLHLTVADLADWQSGWLAGGLHLTVANLTDRSNDWHEGRRSAMGSNGVWCTASRTGRASWR